MPSPSRRVASFSVDLDPLPCYTAIHGLDEPGPALRNVVLRRALPRFLDAFAEAGVRATFFVVGSDLADADNAALLREAARAGHELGNHSLRHPYDLARQPRDAIAADVGACHQALREVLGAPPRGFRAPGYDMSPALLDVLLELGYRYDSSLLPSWPYYGAKAGAMAAMALLGRRSGAVVTAKEALLCPVLPYRPDPLRPHRRGQAGLVELPIATTPGLRLPAFGWTLLLSEPLRRHVLSAMRARPFLNLELHGIDLLDADEDGLPAALRGKQPDLRVPLRDKRRALSATLREVAAGCEVRPLQEVADEVHREGGLR